MSKYFAKYLPVEGEIKKEGGDWVTDGKNICKCESHDGVGLNCTAYFGTHDFANFKLVKLFLCSRDIELKGNNTNEYQYTKDGSYKVIGEISSGALSYVKEGMEYEHNEVFLNGIGQNWNSKTPLGKHIVKIKGPCGHYH